MTRLRLGIFPLLAAAILGGAASASAADFPYGQTLSFTASRNGQPIGTHRLTFRGDDSNRTVTTTVDLAVRVAGIVAYRYSHRSDEVWSNDRLQSLTSKTDDNGKIYAVRARLAGGGLIVEREANKSVLPTALLDQAGLQSTVKSSETMQGEIVPTSHWNIRQVRAAALLNTQHGKRSNVTITPVGREQVNLPSGAVEATRYRYGGDVDLDHWFDARGRWVKMSFKASDGSTIEYSLQE